jgi:EpsI family protein
LSDRLYDNLVTRAYEGAGLPPVMMLLAYNNLQDGVVQVHRPEICYPVGGYKLSVTRPVSILTSGHKILASMFTATGVDRVEQVLYFTRLGGAYPTNWGAQRWAVIQENLRGQVPDGLLLRVSLIEQKQEAALPVLEAFTRDFIAAAPPNLQSLILA